MEYNKGAMSNLMKENELQKEESFFEFEKGKKSDRKAGVGMGLLLAALVLLVVIIVGLSSVMIMVVNQNNRLLQQNSNQVKVQNGRTEESATTQKKELPERKSPAVRSKKSAGWSIMADFGENNKKFDLIEEEIKVLGIEEEISFRRIALPLESEKRVSDFICGYDYYGALECDREGRREELDELYGDYCGFDLYYGSVLAYSFNHCVEIPDMAGTLLFSYSVNDSGQAVAFSVRNIIGGGIDYEWDTVLIDLNNKKMEVYNSTGLNFGWWGSGEGFVFTKGVSRIDLVRGEEETRERLIEFNGLENESYLYGFFGGVG